MGARRNRPAAFERAAELRRLLERHARSVASDSYLAPNGERAAFESDVAAFVAAHPELTVLCTGPWGPYSFAEAV